MGALKICILQKQQEEMGRGEGGTPKKIEPLARWAAKISSSEIKWTFPKFVIILIDFQETFKDRAGILISVGSKQNDATLLLIRCIVTITQWKSHK